MVIKKEKCFWACNLNDWSKCEQVQKYFIHMPNLKIIHVIVVEVFWKQKTEGLVSSLAREPSVETIKLPCIISILKHIFKSKDWKALITSGISVSTSVTWNSADSFTQLRPAMVELIICVIMVYWSNKFYKALKVTYARGISKI